MKTTHEEVIARFKAMLREEYRPGDRLPSERELADRLGVSRPSVREALKALANVGVLETRRGSGTVVARDSAQFFRESMEYLTLLDRPSALEIYEARELVEVFLAGRAAERRTEEDLEKIKTALEEMAANIDNPECRIEPNARFHEAVAAAAHHPVLEGIMASLHHGLRATIRFNEASTLDRQASHDVHVRIYEAIRAARPGEAKAAMRAHMKMARAELQAKPPKP